MAGRHCDYQMMEGVKSAVQRLAAETAVLISICSWRQKVTTILRRAWVAEDQISELLSHRRPNVRVMADYGDRAPDCQREATPALDSWFWQGRWLTKKRLHAEHCPKIFSTRQILAASPRVLHLP